MQAPMLRRARGSRSNPLSRQQVSAADRLPLPGDRLSAASRYRIGKRSVGGDLAQCQLSEASSARATNGAAAERLADT